jgi:hypothetical protein
LGGTVLPHDKKTNETSFCVKSNEILRS